MRIETFEHLGSAIVALPASHRRVAFCVESNALAESFRALVNDVRAAAKATAREGRAAARQEDHKMPAKLIRMISPARDVTEWNHTAFGIYYPD